MVSRAADSPERDDLSRVKSEAPVLLYDGVCGFCDRAVQFILRVDKRRTMQFAALDSTFAQQVFARHHIIADADSVVYVDDPGGAAERVFIRSAAALCVVDYLGGPWRALRAARLVPEPLRDLLYDRFAAERYRIFGKYDSCPNPPQEVRARFIDRLP